MTKLKMLVLLAFLILKGQVVKAFVKLKSQFKGSKELEEEIKLLTNLVLMSTQDMLNL